MRVAVVDIGTNSTRLLIADVDGGGHPEEVEKRSIVTRLGDRVDATGRLADAAQERVFDVLAQYAEAIEEHGAERRFAVMTSAVRDAANGDAFADTVRDRYGLQARTLSGDEEARLTFLGATAARPDDGGPLLVVDIGGGSTELVVGARGKVGFHVSTQVGVVRHSERHLHSDPPSPSELEALARDAREAVEDAVPARVRREVEAVVAVAGTATQCASIDLGLDDHDGPRIEGHVISARRLGELRDTLAALPLSERREVRGLHPDRAPVIVAGTVLLAEVLGAFGLEAFEASERDILWGVALDGAP